MGASSSSNVGYRELRNSIPGSLVNDDDFETFYSLCKVESVRTISTSSVLSPGASQLFYVVLAGEVVVHLSGHDVKVKSVEAVTFTAGETIHFFNSPLKGTSGLAAFEYSEFGECIRNGDIKLSLHFRGAHKVTPRVIGMDRRGFDEFSIRAKSNIHAVVSFMNMSMVEIFGKSPFFKTMTKEQAYIFGTLLKIRLAHTAKSINTFEPPSPMRPGDRVEGGVENPYIIMTLHGEALSIPYATDLEPMQNKLTNSDQGCQGKGSGGSRVKVRSQQNIQSPPSGGGSAPKVFALEQLNDPTDSDDRNNSGRHKSHVRLGVGALTGLDQFYLRNDKIQLRSVLTTKPSVLGYISFKTVEVLMDIDTRFKRVLQRNYNMMLLAWVRVSVPFLMDMDEWSLALLSCKVQVIGVNQGDTIKRQGEPSEYAFILLGGAAKELAQTQGDFQHPERELKWGSLLGVMALTTNQPYFNTVVATEPVMLLRLTKRVLDQIYYNNKAKLCEIRIRLMGVDIDLLHAIDHPRGGELFMKYLEQERAGENLTFYRAVDRFDSMCKDLCKQHAIMLRLKKQLGDFPLLQRGNAISNAHAHSSNDPALAAADDEVTQVTTGEDENGDPLHHSANSSFPNSSKHSPAVHRLAPIMSVSNLRSDGSSRQTSAKESDEDQSKVFEVKQKPLVPGQQRRSFSSRVAVALVEGDSEFGESAEGSDEETRSNNALLSPPNESFAMVTTGAERSSFTVTAEVNEATVDNTATAATNNSSVNVEAYAEVGGVRGLDESTELCPSESRADTNLRQQECASCADTLATNIATLEAEGMLSGEHSVEQVSPKDSAPATRKLRAHRSSFLKAKSDETFSAHQHFDRFISEDHGHEVSGMTVSYASGQTVQNKDALDYSIMKHSNLTTSSSESSKDIIELDRVATKLRRQVNAILLQISDLKKVARGIMETFIYNDAASQINIPDRMRIRCERMFNEWMSKNSRYHGTTTPEFASSSMDGVLTNEGNLAEISDTAAAVVVDAAKHVKLGQHHNSNFGMSMPSIQFRASHGFENAITSEEDTGVTLTSSNISHVAPKIQAVVASTKSSQRTIHTIASVDITQALMENIDLSFVDLFRETKNEILKLLKTDKFPRWKKTKEFADFIANIKPYDQETPGGGHRSSIRNSLRDKKEGGRDQDERDSSMDQSLLSTNSR